MYNDIGESMIKVRNLVKVYKSKKQKKCRAIDNISFDLPNKGMIFIIGKSGSGKSTLLNLLGGLDSPTDGEIEVLGNNINKYQENQLYSYRSSLIGFVFQDFHLINDLTVEENVGMSLKLKSEYNPKLIGSVIKNVDLANYENRYPNELSGGQKQRVAIARAIVKNPSIVLADEPTGNLDVATAKQILKLLKNISKEKLVIIVSHNLDDAYEYGDRIIELKNGKIKSDLMLKNQTGESVFIENNMLIIPSKRKFEQKELDKILEVCKNQKIESIKQIEEKFVDFNGVKDEEIKEEIQDSNLSFFDTLKFSFIFGKNKAFKLVLSSILLTLIISVLSLTQSIKNFDFEEVVKDTVVDNNSIYSIRKSIDGNIGESKLKPITKEDISKFEQIEGNTNVYTLYTEALYVKGQYYVSRLDMPQYNSENIFIQETFGTLVTNEEYAQKLLNVEKLEIYTNDIEYVKGGVYITDYVADAYLHNAVYKNYDEILGIVYENGSTNWLAGYVNGIIITNYRERFKSAIEKLNNLDKKDDEDVEVVKFYDYLRQALAVGYSFEENFLDEASKDVLSKSYWWSHMAFINDVDISDTVPYYSIASYSDILLNDDEVFMDLDTYNRIFNTFYTYNDVDSFVPHKATFNHCDFYGVNCFNKEIIIAKIGKSPISSKILFADNLFQENKKTDSIFYQN